MGNYFKLKYAIALITAFSIDALQFLLGVVIAAAFFHPATALAIVGCVAAETYKITNCWLGGVLGGVVGLVASAVPYFGEALIAMTDAIGAGLAAVVDFCISMIGMAIIIPMLIFQGIVVPGDFFKSWRRTPFLILKIIPGLDMLPFFTGMVIMSIIETESSKKKGGVAGIAVAAGAALATGGTASLGLLAENKGARAVVSQSIAHRERMSRDVEGIMPQEERARSRAPLVDRLQNQVASGNANAPIELTPPELWQVGKEVVTQPKETPIQNNMASLARMRTS